MWPWEHLAVGYLLYSLYCHGRHGRPPGARATLALALGTQFPDLVDKPLAWGLGHLPAGVFAHSLVVAIPVVAAVLALAAHADQTDVGVAFGVGYLSHPPADAVYGLLLGGEPDVAFMFWPFWGSTTTVGTGIVSNLTYYFTRYIEFILSPRGVLYLALELALLSVAVGVWIHDGTPGAGRLGRSLRLTRSE